jgi:hypothetical protein
LPLRAGGRYAIVVRGEERGPKEFKSVQLASALTVDQLSSKEHDYGDEEKEEVEEGREEERGLIGFDAGLNGTALKPNSRNATRYFARAAG